ncbi:rab-interacting lysosomal protein isoform X3 [Pantherophis guttatus]|uniref:Rab-interacting lysosomal protein isoform X3 n=1 Tax=Pantherophis guttatus TaxID=94885 RepID=A0A6P9CAE9_PANGU|nr:rab-interacting lysosomal protein isoform X3 [Pantherophis guttatus]
MEAAYVYRLAAALGSELQRLSDDFGTGALAGLVSQVVRLLELLETLAADGAAGGLGGAAELLLAAPSGEEPPGAGVAERSRQVAEQRLAEAREREQRLQNRLAQLEEEQQRTLSCLAGGQGQEDSPGRQERKLMMQLKEVVDHQRDKIRAQDHEIQLKARDTEAEQEEGDMGGAAVPPEQPPDQRTFSKEELQQILQERNELKTSLFLVEEELAYYQRELLNGERVPALLLHAVKSAIKKQRKKIWAKMLGTEEEPAGREEEEEEGEGWPIGSPGSDCTDGHLPESRIKSFFNQWYHRTSQPSPPESRPGTWEIINAEDVGPGEEQREEMPPSGSSSPGPTSPLP